MNNTHDSSENVPSESVLSESAPSRRKFLQGASVIGGALILGRAFEANAAEDGAVTTPAAPQLVINLDEHEALAKEGGFEILDVGTEKVIVAHTATGFVACSAICPHRGCKVEYRPAVKQFVCPCHNSIFDESGKVVKGPARTDLAPFDAEAALVVKKK